MPQVRLLPPLQRVMTYPAEPTGASAASLRPVRRGSTMGVVTSTMAYEQVLGQIAEEIARTPGRGRSADYIPALAARDPRAFGMAVAELDGTVHGVGEWRGPFSPQSVTQGVNLAPAP